MRDEKEIDKILQQEGVDMTPFEWVNYTMLSSEYWLGMGDPDLPLSADGVSLGVQSGELENIHMKNRGLFAINVDPMRCKHARKQCGLKQADAAKKLGINITYLSEFENGKRKIEKVVLTKMAELYDTEESKLKYTSSKIDPILDQPRTINGTPLSELPKHSRAIRVDSKYRDDLMRGLEYMVGKDKAEPVLALCRTIIFAEKGRM